MSDDDGFEQGTCSACGRPAERGGSGAWWHLPLGDSCYPELGPLARATFQPDDREETCS